MAGYRSLFIRSTHLLSGILPFDRMVKLTGRKLIVPVYHLVSDQAPEHIRHLYAVKGVKQFIEDLDFLLKHYKPVNYGELLAIVHSGETPEKPVFILTFDDGLREFYDTIAPVLLRKGIPAINFLNSDFIGNRDLFFRYKASLLTGHFLAHKELLHAPAVIQWLSRFPGQQDMKKALLSIGYKDRFLIDQLAQVSGYDFRDYLQKEKPYMDAQQIRALIADGFYFGAHSCDHPEYQYIDLSAQLQQTRDSLSAICTEFDLPYRTFAFPFTDYGVGEAFFEQVKNERMLDISFGSAGLKNDPVPGHIQRIPLEEAGLSAKEVMGSEYLYYMIKQFLGKNKVQRA